MLNALYLIKYDFKLDSKKYSFIKRLDNFDENTLATVFDIVGTCFEDMRHYQIYEKTFDALMEASEKIMASEEEGVVPSISVIGQEKETVEKGFMIGTDLSISFFSSEIFKNIDGDDDIVPTIKRISNFNLDEYNKNLSLIDSFDVDMVHFGLDNNIFFSYRTYDTQSEIDGTTVTLKYALLQKSQDAELSEIEIENEDNFIYLFDSSTMSDYCFIQMIDKALDSNKRYKRRYRGV